MPVRPLGRGCYQWSHHGKIYCGPGARQKAERQGRAAHARGYVNDTESSQRTRAVARVLSQPPVGWGVALETISLSGLHEPSSLVDFGRTLKFTTGGDALYRGQWDGYIRAYDARDRDYEHPLGQLDYLSWKDWTDDDPPQPIEWYRVKLVEVLPELRRRGIATALYKKLFEQEGITEANLAPTSLTPEGAAFRKGARLRERRLRERADDWQDALVRGDARYVPDKVRPQMPSIVARALAAGAPTPLEFMGAGMTGVVLCAGDVAYKVARGTLPVDHQFFEEEADWLAAAAAVPDVAPHVARFHGFDPEHLVIVRDCPRADPDVSTYRYGEGKLHDLHQSIERAMVPHGWTAPEFKPDSYIITARGPVLVDASMPARVGAELARYVEAVAASERPLWTTRPQDLAFAIRVETGRTLAPAEADHLTAILEQAFPGSTEH